MKKFKKILFNIFLVLVALLLALDVSIVVVKWMDHLGYLEATEAKIDGFPDILNGGKKDDCKCIKSNPILSDPLP